MHETAQYRDKFTNKNTKDVMTQYRDKFTNKNTKDVMTQYRDKFTNNNDKDGYNFDVTTPIQLNTPVMSHGGSYTNKLITDSEIFYREKYIKYKNKFLNLRKNIK